MSVSRYKLATATTVDVTGSKTFTASNISSFPSSPTPPTGLPGSATVTGEAYFYLIDPSSDGGTWFDWYAYGTGHVLFSMYVDDWPAWVGVSVSSSGGVGYHAGNTVPAYSSMYAARTADGVVSSTGWNRYRLEIPTSGLATMKVFIGSNRHGSTPDASFTFEDIGVLTWVYGYLGSFAAVGSTYWSDLAIGLYSDTVPTRSATDWSPTAAAASQTATGTAAATATRVLAGTPSVTASAAANAGLVLLATATPSITAAGAADAAVITTHDAEAAGEVTVSSAAATTLTRPIYAVSTITASAVATMANQTGADGVIQALGAARIVVEGETSPGFLYSTVAKNVLTS